MPVRLVALDLDGTLVDTRTLVIDSRDAAALRRAVSLGMPVVLATARWPASARQFQQELGIDGPLICHNGALVVDAEGRKVLGTPIDPMVAVRVVRAAIELGLYPTPIVDDVLYGRPRPDQTIGRVDLSLAFHRAHLELVEDLVPIVARGPMDIGVFGDGVASLLELVGGEPVRIYRYVRDGELRGVIFQHPDATKGEALRRLCASLSIALADVLAIGDSEADLPMLEVAGVAVAPANAIPEARERAHWVAPPAGEAPVAAALKRFVFDRVRA